MAYASTVTLIPLQRLADLYGIDPWHFNSIYAASRQPQGPACDDFWYQYDWQFAGKLSRENLAYALKTAEDAVTEYLGYFPMPTWVWDEEVQLTPHYRAETYNFYNSRGNAKSITTAYGHVFEVGRRTKDLIEAGAVTAFSDNDGDGLDERVEVVTVIGTVTDEEEVRVYYPGESGEDRWEIRPLTSVVIDSVAGTITIRFPKYLCALPDLLERSPGSTIDGKIGVDGDDNTNFLQTVDVYRVYTDTTDQATLYAHPSGCTAPCDMQTEAACASIRDARLGVLAYQPSAVCYETYPFKMTVNYRSGYRDNTLKYPNNQMWPSLERDILYYTPALTDTELCGCTNTRDIWNYQREDMALSTGEKSYNRPFAELGNPFGSSRGAIKLWKRTSVIRIARGF